MNLIPEGCVPHYAEQAQRMEKRERFAKVSRLLSIAIGLILFVAALMKATDIVLFVRQISSYGIISHPILLTISARGMVALQFFLGVGLLIVYRPKLVLSMTSALWLVLLVGTTWAWVTGATKDCGCYGAWLKYSPKEATFENLALLTGTLLALKTCHYSIYKQGRSKTTAIVAAAALGFVVPFMFGQNPPSDIGNGSSSLAISINSIKVEGLKGLDLRQGTYLVVIFSTGCEYCKEVLPELDELAEERGLPSVIALCPNNDLETESFRQEFQPLFPVGRIDEEDFWQLLGDGETPRILLFHNGRVKHIWDRNAPEKATIKSALTSL